MGDRVLFSLSLSLAAAALAGAPASDTREKPMASHLVVVQDKTALMFGQHQIGELGEGTRVRLVQMHGPWSKVRACFGANWCEGWMRTSLVVPDSLADVEVRIDVARRRHVYIERSPAGKRATRIRFPSDSEGCAPPGTQFLGVRLKFDANEESPSRVYFNWANKRTADIYLSYGRDGRIVPYGFHRREPAPRRRIRSRAFDDLPDHGPPPMHEVFDRVRKRDKLLLEPGRSVFKSYIFIVPVHAADLELVLKGIVLPVRETRRTENRPLKRPVGRHGRP